MISCRPIIAIGLAMFLDGCAYLYSLDQDLPAQTERWIKTQQYGTALDTLYYIEPSHPNYKLLQAKRQRILVLVNQLEQQTLSSAKPQVDAGRLYEALQIYDAALNKIPDSIILQKARKIVYEKREEQLANIKIKLLEHKSAWLESNEDLHKKVASLTPKNFTARWLLQGHRQEVDDTVLALIECAQDATKINKLDQARSCLNIARHLQPSQILQLQLVAQNKQLDLEVAARARKLDKPTRILLTQAGVSFKKHDLLTTQQKLRSIPQQFRKNAEVQSLSESLQGDIDDYVDQRFREGRRQYSEGNYEDAHRTWIELRQLAPDDERLSAHIERVEKVLLKLHQLSKQQSGSSTRPQPVQ